MILIDVDYIKVLGHSVIISDVYERCKLGIAVFMYVT